MEIKFDSKKFLEKIITFNNKNVFTEEEKLNILKELKDILNDVKKVSEFIIPNIKLFIDMFIKSILYFNEKNNREYQILLYELFFILVDNNNYDILSVKQLFTADFFTKLVELFDIDNREIKNKLATLLHRIYAKIITRRKIIRKIIYNYINIFIKENKKVSGIDYLLFFLETIIKGFQIPMRDEHYSFYMNTLIPLHNINLFDYDNYYIYLHRCFIAFFINDKSLFIPYIKHIINTFPFDNYDKEDLILDELEDFLEYCEIDKLQVHIKDLIKLITNCLREFDIKVVNKTISLFYNPKFIEIIKYYKNICYDILIPVVADFSKNYWDLETREKFKKLEEYLKNIDNFKFKNALVKEINKKMELMKLFPKDKKEEEKIFQLTIKQSEEENKKKTLLLSINEEFDEDFGICPITQEYMKNPVLAPSGQHYEKDAIINWLKKNSTDPLTRKPLTTYMLKEDKEFQKKIIEYRKKFNK